MEICLPFLDRDCKQLPEQKSKIEDDLNMYKLYAYIIVPPGERNCKDFTCSQPDETMLFL